MSLNALKAKRSSLLIVLPKVKTPKNLKHTSNNMPCGHHLLSLNNFGQKEIMYHRQITINLSATCNLQSLKILNLLINRQTSLSWRCSLMLNISKCDETHINKSKFFK